MSTFRDPDRQIKAFLAEGLSELPERIYNVVRSEIDQTHQRVVLGPWRTPDMNIFAKLGTAVVVVALVVVVVANLVPKSGLRPGGSPLWSGASPSPSPSPTTAPLSELAGQPSREPVFADPYLLPSGELAIWTYYGVGIGALGFNVPTSGWIADGALSIEKRSDAVTVGRITFRSATPTAVYTDPCGHARRDLVDPSMADLATAAASVPGTDLVTGPSDLVVGDLSAKLVVFTVREDVKCDAGQFYLWDDEKEGPRPATQLGDTIRVWIIDYPHLRLRFWIEAETRKDASPELGREIDQVIKSIHFAG